MKTLLVILVAGIPGTLAAQATVEAAMGASRAATTASPAQAAGKAIGGAVDALTRTLEKGHAGKATVVDRPKREAKSESISPTPGPVEKAKPAVIYEDPNGIQAGMPTSEVLRRFGPPALQVTGGSGGETLSYVSRTANVDVQVRDGKVTAVNKLN